MLVITGVIPIITDVVITSGDMAEFKANRLYGDSTPHTAHRQAYGGRT